jgi:hypothetical protein
MNPRPPFHQLCPDGHPTDKNGRLNRFLCPYLSSSNSSGSTIFGGIGLRASTPIAGGLTSGYWANPH